ncbi:hypothetical protein [Dokdonia sp. Dokd-P16]|uniref:hypothetical protein n=1 Tax=Dokdonia sp. Dokd-P16 TaxID=2173169 RepID=UPI0013A52E9D|nr:hypothetical protein [Dokdonia sp. Dokd-P16]
MEINKHTLISLLGIGAFGLSSILEFAHLIKYVLEQFLIIYFSNSISPLWVPEVMGTIIFTIGIILCLKLVKSTIIINDKKWLFSLISIFFIIMLLQFLSSFYGTGFLISTFPTEFDNYYELKKENLKLLANLALAPIFRYVIVAIVLIWEVKNHDNAHIDNPTRKM